MRIGLVSDQHANDVAFRAVVEELERIGVDRIVCLGDVAQGGAQPAEVLDRLASLGCETVLGNSDDFLLEVRADSPEPITKELLEVRDWTLQQLDDRHLDQIRAFRPTVEIEADGCTILCFHGSPGSYDDILLPEGEYTDAGPWRAKADVLAGGHTHRQWVRHIGDALFVNPGSVGLVYDHHRLESEVWFEPVAEYAIVYVEESGPAVDLRRVPYSLDELSQAIVASSRPKAAEFAAEYHPLPA